MNRRSFLRTLGLAAAGLTLDPERLLWVPGQKTIFLPSAHTIVTPEWVTREVLLRLTNVLNFGIEVNRHYADAYVVGDRVRFRLPMRYQVSRLRGELERASG
jgi:hypothetical protein